MVIARAVVMVVAVASGVPALAQPNFRQSSYDVKHTFSFTPGNAAIPQVSGAYFAHAWVQESGLLPVADWRPAGQNPGFDPVGTDVGTLTGALNLPSDGSPAVTCLLQSFNIPPAGVNGADCVMVSLGGSHAAACYDFFVAPYGLGTSVDGYVRSSGGTTVAAPHSGLFSAYAFSTAFVGVTGASQLASGQIVWTTYIDGVAGSSHNEILRDPVVITASDGVQTITRTLLTITSSGMEQGGINWDNDTLTVDAMQLSFLLKMDPVVVANPGTLSFEVQGGVVTSSSDSGIYAGLAPAAGTATVFSIPISNKIVLDYDVTPLIFPSNVEIKLSGSGDAPVHTCNADINGDGFVDGIDYDTFFNAFEEGNPEIADYNGDGFVDGIDSDLFNNHFEVGCP